MNRFSLQYYLLICVSIALFASACRSTKKVNKYDYQFSEGIGKAEDSYNPEPGETDSPEEAPAKPRKHKKTKLTKAEIQKLEAVDEAKSFLGVPYKYGGTTKKGMDCSGLIYTSYKSAGRELPRISYQMAESGQKINLSNVQIGDLVCFSAKGRGRIDHVGLVTENKKGVVSFIHSTTSRGVMINTTEDSYWKERFKKAVRL